MYERNVKKIFLSEATLKLEENEILSKTFEWLDASEEYKQNTLSITVEEKYYLEKHRLKFVESCQTKLPKQQGSEKVNALTRSLVMLKVTVTIIKNLEQILSSLHDYDTFSTTLNKLIVDDHEMKIGESDVEIIQNGTTDLLLKKMEEALTSLAEDLGLDENRVKAKGYYILRATVKGLSYKEKDLDIFRVDLDKKDATLALKALLKEKLIEKKEITRKINPKKKVNNTTQESTEATTKEEEAQPEEEYIFKDTLADTIEQEKNNLVEEFIGNVEGSKKCKKNLQKAMSKIVQGIRIDPNHSLNKIRKEDLYTHRAQILVEELKAEGVDMELKFIKKTKGVLTLRKGKKKTYRVIFTNSSAKKGTIRKFKSMFQNPKKSTKKDESVIFFGELSKTQNTKPKGEVKKKSKDVPGAFKIKTKRG